MNRTFLGVLLALFFLTVELSIAAPHSKVHAIPVKQKELISLTLNEIRTSSTTIDGVERFHLTLPSTVQAPSTLVFMTRENLIETFKAAHLEAQMVGPGLPNLTFPAFSIEPRDTPTVSVPGAFPTPIVFSRF